MEHFFMKGTLLMLDVTKTELLSQKKLSLNSMVLYACSSIKYVNV